MQEPGVCPKCGKAKKQSGSGSLTQWISACRCDQIEEGTDQFDSVKICHECGKRIGSNRSGSFTQWVFRQTLCECKQSRDKEVSSKSGAVDGVGDQSIAIDDFSKEEEISVPDFPGDRYAALKKLGSGKHSDVYLANDRILDKLVAVKLMRSLSTEQVIAFQQEARAMSVLSHPNILKILDFGASSGGTPYMVLEYEPGEGLDVYLKNHGKLAWTQVLTMISQICSALTLAHNNGIYHRDIKPGNIYLVLNDDEIESSKLIDFGIAKIQKTVNDPTLPNLGADICGTPAYMSPEQAQGKVIGAPSEIFSIGCVLFECLTGTQLFEIDELIPALIRRAEEDPQTFLDWNQVDVPESVKTIVKRCLAREPSERFQTAAELDSAIQAILNEEESQFKNDERSRAEVGGETEKGFKFKFLSWQSLLTVGLLILGIGFIYQNFLSPDVKSSNIGSLKDEEQSNLSKSDNRNNDKNENPKDKVQKNENVSSAQSTFDEMHKSVDTNKVQDNIDLSGPKTTDADLSGLESLPIKTLKLSRSSITDKGLEKVAKIKTLNALYLNRVYGITAEGLKNLTNLKNLTYLTLNATGVGDDALKVVAQIKTLEVLRLMDNSISEKALLPFSGHPSLKDIDVNRGNTGDGIAALRTVKSLEILRVGTSGVTDEGVKAISGLPNLKGFHIQGNPITGKSLRLIASWPALNDLWIIDTDIKPQELRFLRNARRLEILRVDDLHINDENITELTRLNQIKQLTLQFNDITDRGLIKLASMPNLVSVNVSGCKNISNAGIAKLHRVRPGLNIINSKSPKRIKTWK